MARRLGHAENPRVARHMEKLPLVSHDQGRLGSRRQGWQVRRCRHRSADLLVQQLRSAKMAHLRGGSRSRYALGQNRIAFRIPDCREGHDGHLDVHQVRRRQRRMLRRDEAQPHEDGSLLASRGYAAFFVRQASQHLQELHHRCCRRRLLCAHLVPVLPFQGGICKHRSLRRCWRDGKRQYHGQLHCARTMEVTTRNYGITSRQETPTTRRSMLHGLPASTKWSLLHPYLLAFDQPRSFLGYIRSQ